MSNGIQIRIQIFERPLPDGKTAIDFVLTEWGEDGEHGSITIPEPCAKEVGRWLRRNHRLKWRVTREFLANPITFLYHFFHGVSQWEIWRGGA